MSPAAIAVLTWTLVACGGAHIEAEAVNPRLSLVAEFRGEDLPVVADGTQVSTWVARTGPNLIQDTALAWGMPRYTANALNGHPGLSFNRDEWAILKWAVPFNSTTAEDWTFEVVHVPTTPPAVAETRGYIIGGSDTVGGGPGTRFIVAQNANDTVGSFNNGGFFLDDGIAEDAGVNPGWHRFKNSSGVAQQSISGAQVDSWSFGASSLWVRNGVLIGRGAHYSANRRGLSVRAVLGCNAVGVVPGTSTADFYNGLILQVRAWKNASGVSQLIASNAATKAAFSI